jgi:type II secretory pathway pseudopilin PulG
VRRARRDRGFTLIETVIVIGLIGLVTLVIGATVAVVLRNVPSASFRVDDARAVRGLQTWLAHDVASTPPNDGFVVGQGGFDVVTDWNDCNASGSTNILYLSWFEDDGTTEVEYIANYRLAPDGTAGHQLFRYTCRSIDGGPFIDVAALALTTGFSSSPCPSKPFVQLNKVGSVVESITICLLLVENDSGLNAGGGDTAEVVLEVSSRNPSEFLP